MMPFEQKVNSKTARKQNRQNLVLSASEMRTQLYSLTS